ncbi:Xaa-Pro peptidase family protein [Mesorhizobium sp.]|nr:Xaa-Pro peptidase family protein [Mesorhizobium sp.]
MPSHKDVDPVSLSELERRLDLVLREMRQQDIGVSIITTPDDIYYLSGYYTRAMTSVTALIVPAAGKPFLVTRQSDEGNYLKISDRTTAAEFIAFGDDELADSLPIIGRLALERRSHGRVGIEQDGIFISPAQFAKLTTTLGGTEAVEIGSFLSAQRLIKSAWEIACHRSAARTTVQGMRAGIAAIEPGVFDSDVAAVVASEMVRGGEWAATWPIILTGAQTGRAHSSWQGDAIAAGSPTTLEFSAARHRHHSPLYRTVIYAPNDEQRRFSEAVATAHKAQLAQMRPGARACDVWEAMRAAMERFGIVQSPKGRVGYTVGIGFPPNWVQRNAIDLMRGNTAELRPGMVFHVFASVGQKNVFSIVHSATVVVTEDGHEVLTVDGLDGPLLK